MKKKVCFLFSILIVICLAIVGCSNSESPEESSKNNEPKKEEKKDKEVVIGEKIISDKMEITINNIEFSYDVLPKVKESLYTLCSTLATKYIFYYIIHKISPWYYNIFIFV